MENDESKSREANRRVFDKFNEEEKERKFGNLKKGRIVDLTQESDEEHVEEPFYKKYLTKKNGFIALGVIVTLFVGMYFAFTGKPKNVAEDYIKAIAAGDFGKAYQCLDVKQQATLSQPGYLKFVEFARNSKGANIYKLAQNEIKSIELTEGTEQNGEIALQANIVVKKAKGEETDKLTLYVEKKKTGPLGLFTGYKISGKGVYAVPKINCLTGTKEVTIDGVNLAGEKEKLNLNKPIFYGEHDVECKGKFYDSFKEHANFDQESGMLKLNAKKFKLNSVCQEALVNASKDFATAFFPATLTDNGYKECKTISNEKTLDEMYKSFADGFKQVGVSSIKITDGKLLSSFAGDNGSIHCQYQFMGTYAKNGQAEKECLGVLNLEYLFDNGILVVAKVNDYNIHLKD